MVLGWLASVMERVLVSRIRMEQTEESAGGLKVTKDQRRPRAFQIEIPQENGLCSKQLFKKGVVLCDFHLCIRVLAIASQCKCLKFPIKKLIQGLEK